MHESESVRAMAAATHVATSLGLPVDDVVVLHDSNKLTARLLPCDVVARVAPAAHRVAQFEIDVVRRLAGSPVVPVEPRVEARVHAHDGFEITFWTYREPVPPHEVPPADYASALERLHAGMRGLDIPVSHFTDRVEHARRLVADHSLTPALTGADRTLLADALRDLGQAIVARGAAEQVLHGEPHPGNLLATSDGPLFVDFETCCRGPVEFDLAHAPDEVAQHYPDLDQALLRTCRLLVLTIITTWRWDRDDQLPNGRARGLQGLADLRTALTDPTVLPAVTRPPQPA
ncbi:phosphotransferase family protein [Umezawaea tangerina]|uniref:Thiamine kinase-like enzyme n=1 Tax=Umezawaea tangerina TaxID=84725 RepID=A0A2T0TE09_9PSEU|nr:aminoglycoside phosphotransferase family protein [Umezawaea tangerina]PRY43906.1 thiamine kinase-like enzyme [Umezawaea tangerina]